MKRKIISLVLALVLLVSAMPAALASEGSFTDITDKDVAQAAETLRLLGVVDGVGGGKFEPAKNLTRAQFCKMAIVMMGIEAQEPGYRSRTIFSDVASNHWARGYINLAASGEKAFISGMGNGIFAPDTNITFAQAVTILVRLLGYSDSDTSMQWPEGYLTLADGIGLTDGFDLDANAAVSRAKAAQLFEKMLLCDTKAGTVYLSRFGSVTEKVIMLSNDATAADGSLGAVYTSAGTFKTDVPVADSYIGERGTVVVNDGKLVVFIPTDTTCITVSASTIEAGWFKDSNGLRHTVPSETTVYTDSEKTTWNDAWLDMPMGSNLTLYFDAKGNIETIFYATSSADNVAVAMNEVSGNPFVSLLDGATGYTIYKNGAAASSADIRRYDVAEYDKAANQLRINDVKLTGRYENAYPSEASPEKIKLLGKMWTVLPTAQESLANFKIGDTITLLFTADMRVAGAVSPAAAQSNAVGIVTSFGGGQVSVELLGSGVTLGGTASKGSIDMTGELVTVTSGAKAGEITVRALGGGIKAAKIDTESMTYGSFTISPAVKVFDRVGSAMPVKVSVDDLPADISRSAVLYARQDYAGRIDMLILDDVTGDGYTYGATEVSTNTATDSETGEDYNTYLLTLKNKGGSTRYEHFPINVLKNNSYGGIAVALDGSRVVTAVNLTRIYNVSRSDFKTVGDETTLTVNGVVYPVADNVQCYNAAAGEWFDSLDDARRFSAVLTAYYDRDPAEGGKIRVVVAE